MTVQPTWLDRAAGFISPRWKLNRIRARAAADLFIRHYEAAGSGRRTQGWRRSSGDANVIIGPALARLRENARDLVRNNPYAESAVSTIVDHTVGWGIVAKPNPMNKRALETWMEWAETTACDADGRHDFYGLQKLVNRTVVESGEVLVRRRIRRPEDGFPLPIQLQVLDPDFLDTLKDTTGFPIAGTQNRIIQGVEFDAIGRRIAYWLFPEHPGSAIGSLSSVRVPAESVLHIFKPTRPGQVRAPSWFAPVLLRFKDFDEFEDATLMKQKIAACLAVLTSDVDGAALPPALGTADDTTNPGIDSLEPGAILNMPAGRTVEVVQPPSVNEYGDYSSTVLRAIATGLGVTYEDLTGDYSDMPFSAARMSRLRHEARIHDWRWRVLIPQFCDPVWNWVMEVAVVMNRVGGAVPQAAWTPQPLPLVDPQREGAATQQLIRAGLQTLPEAIRERGYDPDELLAEYAAWNKKLDDLGIVLDSDPRQTSAAGLTQARPKGTVAPAPGEYDTSDGEDAAVAAAKKKTASLPRWGVIGGQR
jgi:lambda family phage portal protein